MSDTPKHYAKQDKPREVKESDRATQEVKASSRGSSLRPYKESGKTEQEAKKTPPVNKRRKYVIIFLVGIAVGIIGFEAAYVMSQAPQELSVAESSSNEISDSPVKVYAHDISNYESTAEQVDALQKSIPHTENIKAFNGASLSLEDFDAIKSTIKQFNDMSYSVSFVMINLETGKGIAYNTDQCFYSASAIKAPFIASLLSMNSLGSARVSNPELNSYIQNVLIWSDNDSYFNLVARFGSDSFRAWGADAGIEHTIQPGESFTDFTSADLAKMWLQIYSDYTQDYIDEDIRALATNPEISAINSILGEGNLTWSKAGWIPNIDGLSSTNDAGIIKTPQSTYVLAVCSDAPSNFDLLNEMVYTLSQYESNLM